VLRWNRHWQITQLDTLLGELIEGRYTTVKLTFNTRSNVSAIYNIIGAKLKRRNMGVLGPENNKKAFIFIDDFNLPRKEIFGAQPVLKLIGQWFDHEGWYDMNEFEFKKIIDIFFLTAMGLPGGGRSEISRRLVRHCNILG